VVLGDYESVRQSNLVARHNDTVSIMPSRRIEIALIVLALTSCSASEDSRPQEFKDGFFSDRLDPLRCPYEGNELAPIDRAIFELLRVRENATLHSLDDSIRHLTVASCCLSGYLSSKRILSLSVADLYPLDKIPIAASAGCGLLRDQDFQTMWGPWKAQH
jgi:hypothetical protein